MPYAVAGLSLAIAIVLYQLFRAIFSKDDFIGRMSAYTGQQEEQPREEKVRKTEYRPGVGILARGIEKSGMMAKYRANLRRTLMKANILMKAEEFIAIQVIAMVIGGVLGMIFFGQSVLFLLMAAIALAVPVNVVKVRIRKRLRTINSQLGDTIAILSNSLKAGHSFFQAVDSVSKEMVGPVAEEFTKLQREISLGGSTESALENMVKRVGSDDLELMVTAVLIQRQIGGNLSEILDNISSTIRQRIKTKGEIKALTAQGRMSGWIISLLPFFLSGMMMVLSPQSFTIMFTNPIGIAMLVMALVSEIIGIMLVNKIVSVEV